MPNSPPEQEALGHMRRLAVAILFVASTTIARAEETSVVLGKARAIKFVDVDIPCPEGYICMDAWYRYDLSIDKVLTGPVVPSRIRAVHVQHTNFVPSYRKALRAFVLRPIVSAEDRAELNAEFYIDDLSPTHELYCLNGAPGDFGISSRMVEVAGKDQFCFAPEEMRK